MKSWGSSSVNFVNIINETFYAPTMTMAGALSVTPVCPYLRPYVCMYVTPNQ